MSKVRTNSETLKNLKQYNKTARETKAIKEGFATAADFITYLETEIRAGRGNSWYTAPTASPCKTTTQTPTTQNPSTKKKDKTVKAVVGGRSIPMIHVIDILDSSGSMHGAKIAAAIKGINMGIGSLKSDTAEVEYTYTLCDFSDDIIFRYLKVPLSAVREFKGETRGSTALFDAIGKSVESLKPNLQPGDKVLVNIYTDGQENSSRHFTAEAINTLIKALSETGWTFTFIGTKEDVAYAQSRLSFKASNTLIYDGTAKGLEKSFMVNNVSRSAYSSAVADGLDVSEGFFKDIN